MYYADIHKRNFVDGVDQYRYFREENHLLLKFFDRFPLLPKNQEIKYHDQWEFPKFQLHKISYMVEPELKVFAYLLIPSKISEKKAGILALHQHNDEYMAGKSETIGMVRNPEYTKLEAVEPDPKHQPPKIKEQYSYARDLVNRGYIVLAPDFIGFEEYRDRDWHLDDYYDSPQFLRGYEDMLFSKYLLYGSNTMAKHLHDCYVSLTILSSLTQVKSDQLGVIGHSLGGEVTTILTAFDQRVKASVNSCGIVCYDDFVRSNRMESAEGIIPGFLKENRDVDFYLDMVPPTPFFLSISETEAAGHCKSIISQPRENFETMIFDGGHSFPLDARERAYQFLENHLML